jgi:hypothetical protein
VSNVRVNKGDDDGHVVHHRVIVLADVFDLVADELSRQARVPHPVVVHYVHYIVMAEDVPDSISAHHYKAVIVVDIVHFGAGVGGHADVVSEDIAEGAGDSEARVHTGPYVDAALFIQRRYSCLSPVVVDPYFLLFILEGVFWDGYSDMGMRLLVSFADDYLRVSYPGDVDFVLSLNHDRP